MLHHQSPDMNMMWTEQKQDIIILCYKKLYRFALAHRKNSLEKTGKDKRRKTASTPIIDVWHHYNRTHTQTQHSFALIRVLLGLYNINWKFISELKCLENGLKRLVCVAVAAVRRTCSSLCHAIMTTVTNPKTNSSTHPVQYSTHWALVKKHFCTVNRSWG